MAEIEEPESIEKALLAEDIVNYFIHGKLTRKDASKYENCVECFKELVFNGLYEAIQKVFESLNDSRDHVINEDFKHLKNREKLNKECFEEYAMSFRKVLLWEDFDTMCFLRYCLYVCGMAGMFYKNGVDDAPNMAVEMIKIGFPEGSLPDEFWEIFYKAVTKYVSEECSETDTKSEASASLPRDDE